MEQREPLLDCHAEGIEGRLRELTTKWFMDTQMPLIAQNGFFPTWFLGFITRKDAEEILVEKELGCFLIRLSDKAIGYILSYKGRDRCRHFVINQSESGQLVVCGDTEGHDTVSDLIEYYKARPIQPFGEHLTSACFEEAPPLPQRSRHLDSGPLNNQDGVLYAQLRKHSPRQTPRFHISQDTLPGCSSGRAERSTAQHQNTRRCSPTSIPASVYSELGQLDSSSDGEQSYSLSARPHTPPRLSPKPIRQTTRYEPEPEKMDSCSRPSSGRHSLENMSHSPIYHLAGRPSNHHNASMEKRPEQHGNSLNAEVPVESLCGSLPHTSTHKLSAGLEDAGTHRLNSNAYEDMEDIRPKHSQSSWGVKVSNVVIHLNFIP
uniref:SH2 domain-containing protein n=1 Tax=Mola mola TaxID=94237 RepID=A0A3Q4AHX6_MOLML